MSIDTTGVVANGVGMLPTLADERAREDALIARVKDVIAGRVRPDPLAIPPDILEFFRKEFEGYEPPPTPEALRMLSFQPALHRRYRGEPVVCFKLGDGTEAVLASGERDITTLFRGLSGREVTKIIIRDTVP